MITFTTLLTVQIYSKRKKDVHGREREVPKWSWTLENCLLLDFLSVSCFDDPTWACLILFYFLSFLHPAISTQATNTPDPRWFVRVGPSPDPPRSSLCWGKHKMTRVISVQVAQAPLLHLNGRPFWAFIWYPWYPARDPCIYADYPINAPHPKSLMSGSSTTLHLSCIEHSPH